MLYNLFFLQRNFKTHQIEKITGIEPEHIRRRFHAKISSKTLLKDKVSLEH